MQSLPSDLYAYTFKNPKRKGSFSNMLADMYNITHMSPLWHISASDKESPEFSRYDACGQRRQTEVSTGIPIEGDNKRKAKKKMEELREEYRLKYEVNKLVDTQNMLFSKYMDIWLENHKKNIRQSTYEGYREVLDAHIIPYFKKIGVALIDIQPIHIDTYYTYLIKSGRGANTVKHHHANIRKALKQAFLQNMIPYNPADRVELPKIKPYEAKVFTLQEMAVILNCVKDTVIEPAIILAIYYALRRGEICGLCWEDIDF